MNLLLLLSALLSALSGLGGSARAPISVQAVAGASAGQPAARSVQRAASVRPVAAMPDRFRVAVAPIASALLPAVAIPLWTTRRRE